VAFPPAEPPLGRLKATAGLAGVAAKLAVRRGEHAGGGHAGIAAMLAVQRGKHTRGGYASRLAACARAFSHSRLSNQRLS